MSGTQRKKEENVEKPEVVFKEEKKGFSFTDFFKPKVEAPLPDVVKPKVKEDIKDDPKKKTENKNIFGEKISANKTMNAIRNNGGNSLGNHPNLMQAMQNIMSDPELQHDEISDEEARNNVEFEIDFDNIFNNDFDDDTVKPVEVTNANLPSIINKAIGMYDPTVHPDWHQIKSLPGYLKAPIRSMGRQLFANFTTTRIEDMQLVSTITNSQNEVNGVVNWVKKECIKDDEANFDFERFAPGVHARASLWNSEHYTFLVAQDDFGSYIYGWAGGRAIKLDDDFTNRPKLK
jgi:hypothetical protein